ncbi:uncharacterized protein [Parasteatoda tepidariorum]|uniref:uncharacterized protein isoform X1 n=1 Tax=Parasteatoda tepidariorum TaxID=114398 RepID=UPI001C718609|nr:uncharacterized protein LOC107439946 isoform X1 [Parasteatoda tepidariorum]
MEFLWSFFFLITTVSACGYPGSPAHSSIAFNSEVIVPGTVATYTCDSGFELLGPARRICATNGTWTPIGIPFCVLNVAVGKAPMQSSLSGNGIPQKAIDGSTSTFFNADTCSMTQTERSPWWYVNLLEPYMVQLVRLDFGASCCTNKATIVVRVGNNRPDLGVNPVCHKYTGFLEEGRPLFLPCTTAMPGAFVSVYLEDPPSNQLSICEAFVYTDQALPIERCPSFRDQPLGSTSTYNGKCYLFYNNQPRNFLSARRFCEIRGGNLIDESSPALQGFLSWELFRRHRNDPNGQYWLGAVRDPSNNNWKWTNGHDVTISFWNSPGSKENCSRFDGSRGWLWSETNCNMNLNYICQHKPATCGKPERPANSTIIARNFDIGSVIEYRCDVGHLLIGPNIRTCLATGVFSEFPPKCRYLKCGSPAQIDNGYYQLLNGTQHYLSTVQYTCNEGHVLVGRGSLVCDVDEKWNGPPPRCDPFYCRQPPPILNGYSSMSSNATIFGTVTRYYCNEGFEIKGKNSIKCVASGYWDGEPPLCLAIEEKLTYVHSSRSEVTSTTMQSNESSIETTTGSTIHKSAETNTPKKNFTITSMEHISSNIPSTLTDQVSFFTSTSTSTFSKSRPSWTPPPLEIIPIDDDSLNTLDESPSNRIPSYQKPSDKSLYSNQRTTLENQNSVVTESTMTPDIPMVLVKNNAGSDINKKVKYGNKFDGKSLNNAQAKLNMGGIIALGVFGGFILLAITVTLILIFVRRTKKDSGPSVETSTTYDNSSGAENGLHKFYKRAWENLRYDGKSSAGGLDKSYLPITLQETLDGNNGRGTIEGFRDASEITVNDVAALYTRPDKKHSDEREESPDRNKKAIRQWYSQQLGHHSRRGAF